MTIDETISYNAATENVNIQHIAESQTLSRNTITTAADGTPEANDDRNNNMPTMTITAEDITSTQNEFFIKTIVSHKVNRSRWHTHSNSGGVLYRLLWKGYRPSDSTWDPLHNLTRPHVIY